MSDYPNTPHELGWDDEITNDSSYVLLEEGDYQFTVTAFERGRFPGSAKLPPCKKAILTLSVTTQNRTVAVKWDHILWSDFNWKLAQYLRAIGQMKPDEESILPRWNEMVGSRGRAHFKPRTFTKKDGSEGKVNAVEKFYDYDPAAMTAGDWTDTGNVPTPWDSEAF